MQREDLGKSISDFSYARRMLRRSSLTRIEQRQVLSSASAAWDADSIETALAMMYSDAHQTTEAVSRVLSTEYAIRAVIVSLFRLLR